MSRAWAAFGMGLVWLLAGCEGDDDPALVPCVSDSGGESEPTGKDGDPRDRDAGGLVWMPRDSGVTRPPVMSPTVDAGSNAMCAMRRSPLPAALLPRCSPTTGACLAACPAAVDPDSCRDACIKADSTPAERTYGLDCGGCIYLPLFACVD